MTIKKGLKVFSILKFTINIALVVESDCQNAMKWCKNMEEKPWRFWEVFCGIDALILEIGDVTFYSVFCEANEIANHLAKLGVNKKEMFITWW
ncbi:hypothetical protein REPUB_Repub14bG0098300 [Reevesia pubescens]